MKEQYFAASLLVIVLVISVLGYLGSTIAKSQSAVLAMTTISTTTTVESTATTTILNPGQFFAKHVIVIFLENENATSIAGNNDAPYINDVLLQNYSVAENYHSIAHPSLPNYVAAISGGTFNITSNNYPIKSIASNSVVDLLEGHNVTWKAYMESMPGDIKGVCDSPILNAGGTYGYFTKHDPFAYFTDVMKNKTRCTKVVPLTQFSADLADDQLPEYSFITPNILDDGHTTPLNASACPPSGTELQCADIWLSGFMPRIIGNPVFANTIVFITWDESIRPKNANVTDTMRVPLIVVSPYSKKGFVDDATVYSHYSLLATVEKIENIGNLGLKDTTANVLSGMFRNETLP